MEELQTLALFRKPVVADKRASSLGTNPTSTSMTNSYIVEKLDEVPSIEIKHSEVNSLSYVFQSNAVIYRVNGF